METNSVHWALNNHKELQLRVTQLDWVKEWFLNFYDFQVSIFIDGKTHIGRGIGESAHLAFAKASTEAFERAICFENKTSSCGVAAHTNLEYAKLNAKNELIERDRFFCHYLTKTPLKRINPDISTIDFPKISHKLKNLGTKIKVFEMNHLNSTSSIICISQGSKSGWVLGLGASCDKGVAIQKALTECLMNTVAALHGKTLPLDLKEFQSSSRSRPELHRRLYFQESELTQNNQWIFNGENNESYTESIPPESFEYKQLATQNKLLRECPIVVIKCQNPLLQKSFYGNFDLKNINLDRIQKFSKNSIKNISGLNQLPHPLG